jgi:hypothetical protein
MKVYPLPKLILMTLFVLTNLILEAKPSNTTPSIIDPLRKPKVTSEMSGKPLLVILYTNWSATYKRMRSQTFSVEVIRELLGHFHTLYFDAEDPENGPWIRQNFQASVFPTILSYSPSEKLGSIQGFHPPHAFYSSLDFWYEKWRLEELKKTGIKPPHPLMAPYQGESRSRKELRLAGGFQLKTGRILQGVPISVIEGIVTLDNRGIQTEIPQNLFTPKARDAILPLAKHYMHETKALVSGPFPSQFKPLKSLTEMKKTATLGEEPVLVLVDPGHRYFKGLKSYLQVNRRTRNDLTYSRNYVLGEKVSSKTYDLISKTYQITYPALILLRKNKNPEAQSNLRDARSFLSALASWNLGQLRKQD